jgi:hypothetical protein
MASLDRDIDRLYQLPLSDFTKSRTELAKRAGAHAAAIRGLQKPNLAAWAVNQLYWHDRARYEALVSAAELLRKAQVASLTGKAADVAEAEAAHHKARKEAVARVRVLLKEAGEPASAATMTAVGETLGALPAGEPGRLTRPLKPMGFEGLAGLLKGRAPKANVVPFPQKTKTPKVSAEQKKKEEEAERRKEEQRRAAELRDARADEARAETVLKDARAALEKAEKAREAAAERLEATETEVKTAADRFRRAERDAASAARIRQELER